MVADYDRALARVPKWIVALGLLGTTVAGRMGGNAWAGSFFVGSIAAWINFKLIERAVNRLGELAAAETGKVHKPNIFRMFLRFAFFVLGAFVILKVSGLNTVAALCGLLVCPGAVLAEIFYELITYGHS